MSVSRQGRTPTLDPEKIGGDPGCWARSIGVVRRLQKTTPALDIAAKKFASLSTHGGRIPRAKAEISPGNLGRNS